jgi:hypothetical protein
LGIALIALPEPFTTPFGVALVLISRYLSKRHEASRNECIQETVNYYLAHTGRFSGDAYGESSAPVSVKRYIRSEEPAILGQITGSRSFEAKPAPSVWQGQSDMRDGTVHHILDMHSLSGRYKAGDSFKVEPDWSDTSRRAEKVIYHTINWERLSRCYESRGSAVAHSSLARTSGAMEGAAEHYVNMKLLSQRYKTVGAGEVKVKHHNIDRALLRQRYGLAMCKMALQAC